MALTIGFEPTTDRLTADCSTVELSQHPFAFWCISTSAHIVYSKPILIATLFLNFFKNCETTGEMSVIHWTIKCQ